VTGPNLSKWALNHPSFVIFLMIASSLTVSLHNVDVQRFDPGTVVISQGLEGGGIVVTAGIQALHPGQKIRLLGSPS
jgi:membrane fusion protein, multidrug efflux system